MSQIEVFPVSVDRLLSFAPPPGHKMRDLSRDYVVGINTNDDFMIGNLLWVKWTDVRKGTWSEIAQNNVWLPLYIMDNEISAESSDKKTDVNVDVSNDEYSNDFYDVMMRFIYSNRFDSSGKIEYLMNDGMIDQSSDIDTEDPTTGRIKRRCNQPFKQRQIKRRQKRIRRQTRSCTTLSDQQTNLQHPRQHRPRERRFSKKSMIKIGRNRNRDVKHRILDQCLECFSDKSTNLCQECEHEYLKCYSYARGYCHYNSTNLCQECEHAFECYSYARGYCNYICNCRYYDFYDSDDY